MSLRPFSSQTSLFGLGSLLDRIFPSDNRYRIFWQTIYPLLVEQRPLLEALYCSDNGRPGLEPVMLLGVSILQYLDRLPDRQAAEALEINLGWKVALGLDLDAPGFHPTSLVYFRDRLLEHDQGRLAFDAVLQGLEKAGLVPQRGKQRLDSTHVLGLVKKMSALERVREAIRLALLEWEAWLADAPHPAWWGLFWERYVESQVEYRSAKEVLQGKLQQAGQDLAQVIAWMDGMAKFPEELTQARQLRRIFTEQFEWAEGSLQIRKSQPAGAVQNPHDPQAQWCAKGKGADKKEWVGYKVQVAETVPETPAEGGPAQPSFLTAVETQPATGSDEAGLEQVLAVQAEQGLERPSELYVDGAYVSGAKLAEAQREGWELIGPAQPPPATGSELHSDAFEVSIQERRAICPGGQVSRQCSRLEEQATGKVTYRFEWGSADCRECPLRPQCVTGAQTHRTLVVGEHHEALQARRQEMKTPEFEQKKRRRNAIEGTQSELVRGHGMRRARYRGLAKVSLQNYLIGAACNVKRWLRVQIAEVKRAAGAVLQMT
jgi:IS5 family transposase